MRLFVVIAAENKAKTKRTNFPKQEENETWIILALHTHTQKKQQHNTI